MKMKHIVPNLFFKKMQKEEKIGGYKIALASKVQQQLCSINNPIAGEGL